MSRGWFSGATVNTLMTVKTALVGEAADIRVTPNVHSEPRAPLLRASDSAVLLACYGCGIWRSRQIFRARKSLISRWRGTVEVRFAARFT
jgi:hypothetical protein